MKILEENHIQSKGKDISQKIRTYSLKFVGRKEGRKEGREGWVRLLLSLTPLLVFQPFLKAGFQGFQQFCLHKVQKIRGLISFGFVLILISAGNDYCNFPKADVSFSLSLYLFCCCRGEN